MRNGTLIIKGAEITLDGENVSQNGIVINPIKGKSGTATIGTSTTKKVDVSALNSAISNTAGSLTLDAKAINLKTTKNTTGVGVIELLGSDKNGPSVNTIGQNATSITIKARQQDKDNTARNAFGIRAFNDTTLNLGNKNAESVTIDSTVKGKAYGVLAMSVSQKTTTVNVHGKNITVTANGGTRGVGVNADSNSNITIGDVGVSNVTINATNTENDPDQSYCYGVWVTNKDPKNSASGQASIKGNKVEINATGIRDVNGIFVASSSLTPKTQANLDIVANKIVVTASTTTPGVKTNAVSTMSKGNVNLVGDVELTADNALLARGDSSIVINKDGKHTTVLNGDIVFDYDQKTSNTPVDANVDVTLAGANSSWTGNTLVSWNGETSADTLKVTKMQVAIKNGATWTPTAVTDSTLTDPTGSKGVAMNSLTLDKGNINITQPDVHVTVEKMTGTGIVNLATNLNAPEGAQSGSFTVQNATKNSALDINLMDSKMQKALTSDDVSQKQAQALKNNIGGKDVTTTLAVNEGMYNPGYTLNSKNEVVSHGPNTLMQSTLELATATPLALNRILMNDVRKRLGDIRSAQGTSGAWARYDGGRLSGLGGYENDFNTIQVGIDTQPTADPLRFGLAFSYTKSDTNYARGSADMDAYSLAGYGLWLGENGQFVDVVARMATAKTDMNVDGVNNGAMDNVAMSLSGEFGWRFDVMNNFFVEPQIEATYTYVDAEKLTLTDGANFSFDVADSLLGRAGLAFGMKCPNNKGNVYAKLSAVHEFLGDTSVTGGNGTVYSLDGKDTWVEYGFGANFNITNSTYIWADVERTSGGTLDEDYRATLGVKYLW